MKLNDEIRKSTKKNRIKQNFILDFDHKNNCECYKKHWFWNVTPFGFNYTSFVSIESLQTKDWAIKHQKDHKIGMNEKKGFV